MLASILYFRFMLFILFSLSLDLDIDYDAETELFFEECKIFMSQFVDEVFIQEWVVSKAAASRCSSK